MYEIFVQLLMLNNITAYRLCKLSGISQTTISNWKSGRSIPKNDKRSDIADILGVSLDYLDGKTSVITCKSCGLTYDPLADGQNDKHKNIHSNWNRCCEKFKKIINVNDPASYDTAYSLRLDSVELYIEYAYYSFFKVLMEQSYDLNYYDNFREFIIDCLNGKRIIENVDTFRDELIEKYEISDSELIDKNFVLSAKEIELILNYRAADNAMKETVNRMLTYKNELEKLNKNKEGV